MHGVIRTHAYSLGLFPPYPPPDTTSTQHACLHSADLVFDRDAVFEALDKGREQQLAFLTAKIQSAADALPPPPPPDLEPSGSAAGEQNSASHYGSQGFWISCCA